MSNDYLVLVGILSAVTVMSILGQLLWPAQIVWTTLRAAGTMRLFEYVRSLDMPFAITPKPATDLLVTGQPKEQVAQAGSELALEQPLNVVFDHPCFVVLNKPAGIAVHRHQQLTLLDAARRYFNSDDIHPVHRLDMATSGLIVLAKTAEANRELCQAFADQAVQKIYIALSIAKPKKKQGWVTGDMQKSRGGSYKLLHSCQNPASTYALSFGCEGSPRLWLLRPKTGKTHQLRVALKSLGAPILGDNRYGGANADRLYLHALALKFNFRAEPFEFVAKPEAGQFFNYGTFERLAAIGNVWSQAWPKKL